MKVLITGASGFVGHHLIEHLAEHPDYELIGTGMEDAGRAPHIAGQPMTWYSLDIRDADGMHKMLAEVRPDWVFHLAGQAFVPRSLEYPWETLEINIQGQLNLIQGILAHPLETRVLVVSSAHVYGKISPEDNPIDESQPFRPDSPYAVSKIAQDMLGLQYHLSHDVPIIRARAFNHIGPGQNTRFALPNFAQQIAAIERGEQDPVIQVGDLTPRRDFTDVRDVVKAYAALLEHGHNGEAYNVCRGENHAIGDLLDQLCAMSTHEIEVTQDPSRLRPLDVSEILGDNQKLRQHTGWQPSIAIQDSLQDILQDARRKTESDHIS